MKPVFFDLETGPLDPESLAKFKPQFEAAKNLKDPEKVKASIEEKEREWRESAALSALTGKILVVGWLYEDSFCPIIADEREILVELWNRARQVIEAGGTIVGFCSTSFDWPFAERRSFHHQVPVPRSVRAGRYLSDSLIDLAERWACGSRDPRDRISLDNLSKHLGTGQKSGDGADFAQLWVTDRPKALEYLKNDLVLTQKAYERLYL